MQQYLIISIIGIVIIGGLAAIVYFFGMKYCETARLTSREGLSKCCPTKDIKIMGEDPFRTKYCTNLELDTECDFDKQCKSGRCWTKCRPTSWPTHEEVGQKDGAQN